VSAAAAPLVFVLDDEPSVGRLVASTLQRYQFRTEEFASAAALSRRLRSQAPDVAIVDLGLPDRDGLDVVRSLAMTHGCGILVLTGRDSVADRVLGLEVGADDYLTKPFDPRELVARVRSIVRRRQPPAGARRIARFGSWCFDAAGHTLVGADGAEVRLSAAEAQLLLLFVSHPNRVLSREQLSGNADLPATDRSIDIRVSRLRAKLEPQPDAPPLIRTVYGAGYLFCGKVDWE